MDLTNILNYNRQIMEARDEHKIIEALLLFSMDLTGAKGTSFVPFDQSGRPEAVSRRGEFPVAAPEAWLEYLASAGVRHACQECSQRKQLVHFCPLLKEPLANFEGIYCAPLILAGQELGILNLYQPVIEKIDANQETLAYLQDITSLALKVSRQQHKERLIFQQIQSFEAASNPDLSLLQYKVLLDERARLGREIHDGLAQTIGFLKLQVAQMQILMERQEYDRVRDMVKSCYKTLGEAYQDAREAVDNLRSVPGNDPECRFQDWLHQTVEAFKQDQVNQALKIRLECTDIPASLPPEVHAQLIRIVQEALSNIRKHAQATAIEIRCDMKGECLVLEVRDNGIGFDTQEVPALVQHGLRGMRERADAIGAELQVVSLPAQGTTVCIRLPLSMRPWTEM